MEKMEWEKPVIKKVTEFDVHENVVANSMTSGPLDYDPNYNPNQ